MPPPASSTITKTVPPAASPPPEPLLWLAGEAVSVKSVGEDGTTAALEAREAGVGVGLARGVRVGEVTTCRGWCDGEVCFVGAGEAGG